MATMQNTFGALEIGVTASVFLFGFVTLQTHMYFQRFPEDRRVFKALVRTQLIFSMYSYLCVYFYSACRSGVFGDHPFYMPD